ncbi:unnamed protein product, partial [Lymnaea stagnalis]
ISDEALEFSRVAVSILFLGLVSLFGIVANVFVIAVLRRQGFQESVNISLLGLAIADLCCVTLALWSSICNIFLIGQPRDFSFEPYSLLTMTGNLPRVIFSRVTCWITALIALERCICVTLPFRVKVVFTLKTTLAATVAVFLAVLLGYLSIFESRHWATRLDRTSNTTKYYMVFSTTDWTSHLTSLLFLALPITNILTLMICTLILTVSLSASSNWRESARSSKIKREKRAINPTKEMRVSKMVLILTLIFIACNLPSNMLIATRTIVPEFQEIGKLQKLFRVTHTFAFLLETTSSSINVFVYYRMGSKFKLEFLKMITCVKTR